VSYSSVDSTDSTSSERDDVIDELLADAINGESSSIQIKKNPMEDNEMKSTNGVMTHTNGLTHPVIKPDLTPENGRQKFHFEDAKSQSRSAFVSVQEIGRLLGHDIVIYFSRKLHGNAPKPVNSHVETLRQAVDYLAEKHEVMFAGMMKKLPIEDGKAMCRSFVTIADEMFADRQYKWGRVVTLYTFAACLARHCAEQNLGDEWIEKIGEMVGHYVAENISEWITKQGGWDDMDKFFPEKENFETKVWRGLFYTMLGLGALVTTMAAVR